VLVAALMGGSHASQRFEGTSDVYFGLEFFLLNLILLGVVFIPIERIFWKRDQPIFRGEWHEDLFCFFISSLFVQSLTYLSLTHAATLVATTGWAEGIRGVVASQSLLLQFFEIMFFTDMVQYWFHRAFHEIPWLWKFHAVHHSAKHMDWIAGSRMHRFEIVLLRAFTTLPMCMLGFDESALYAYIFFSNCFLCSCIRIFVSNSVGFNICWRHHGFTTGTMELKRKPSMSTMRFTLPCWTTSLARGIFRRESGQRDTASRTTLCHQGTGSSFCFPSGVRRIRTSDPGPMPRSPVAASRTVQSGNRKRH